MNSHAHAAIMFRMGHAARDANQIQSALRLTGRRVSPFKTQPLPRVGKIATHRSDIPAMRVSIQVL